MKLIRIKVYSVYHNDIFDPMHCTESANVSQISKTTLSAFAHGCIIPIVTSVKPSQTQYHPFSHVT